MAMEFNMPSEENKQLVRRYYEEIVNTGDISSIENFIGREYTEVYEGKRHVIGVKGAKDHILGVRQTYPDLHITIGKLPKGNGWFLA